MNSRNMTTEDRDRIRAATARLRQPRPMAQKIIEALADGPATLAELSISLPTSQSRNTRYAVRSAANSLIRDGLIRQRLTFDPNNQGRRVECAPLEILELAQ